MRLRSYSGQYPIINYLACEDEITSDESSTLSTSTLSTSTSEAPTTESMTDITREEFPREFPIFPKETTTPRLTDIEPDQETVVPEMQETSSKVRIQRVL